MADRAKPRMSLCGIAGSLRRFSVVTGLTLSSLVVPAVGQGQDDVYDLVLLNGRVIDPESGLDAIRNVGISGGEIAGISEDALSGEIALDVSGLVVAPGFIDLHAHGQTERDARMQAQDGVTTALDLESGALPVGQWYQSRADHAPINFGVSAGHLGARIKLKHDVDIGHAQTSPRESEFVTDKRAWALESASPEELDRIIEYLEIALDEGALGIGIMPEYIPGASREEVFRVFELAARRGVTVFIHVRSSGLTEPGSGVAGFQEALADAAATGASLHVVHVTSVGLVNTSTIFEMIDAARGNGIDVTTEAYPYTAGSTALASAYFDGDWQGRLGITYGDLQWSATGERLTRETFLEYRQQPGWVIMHMIPSEVVDFALVHPQVLVASDGIPFNTGGEHPRGAGTFSRVVGHFARDQGLFTLMEALRKVSLMPAQRLEAFVPQMARKGRVQVGADADVVVFDAAVISDQATFENPMRPSSGIAHVLVGGEFIVRNSEYVEGASPGRPIRNAH